MGRHQGFGADALGRLGAHRAAGLDQHALGAADRPQGVEAGRSAGCRLEALHVHRHPVVGIGHGALRVGRHPGAAQQLRQIGGDDLADAARQRGGPARLLGDLHPVGGEPQDQLRPVHRLGHADRTHAHDVVALGRRRLGHGAEGVETLLGSAGAAAEGQAGDEKSDKRFQDVHSRCGFGIGMLGRESDALRVRQRWWICFFTRHGHGDRIPAGTQGLPSRDGKTRLQINRFSPGPGPCHERGRCRERVAACLAALRYCRVRWPARSAAGTAAGDR